MGWPVTCRRNGRCAVNEPRLHLLISLHRAAVYLTQAGYGELARGIIGVDYSQVRAGYLEDISAAMMDYVISDAPITRFRNEYRRAILEFFDVAYFTGYIDSGGQVAQMEDGDRQWILDRMQQEIGYADRLFDELKALRKESENTQELVGVVMHHAEGYARTLDAVYAEGVMRGGRDEKYTFDGEDGMESCPECQKMKGKEMRAADIVAMDLIPYPGTPHYSCHGYNCRHFWLNTQTGQVLMG